MSVYMTEEEQIESIKQWWKRYGTSITIAASCVLLVLSGYQYWHWHKTKVQNEASNAYERMMYAFAEQNSLNIKAYANQLITEYGSTVYADAARLTLAKIYVNQEQYEKAQAILERVIQHSKLKAFQQIARIRLARLLVNQQAYDKALAKLAVVDDNGYMPVIKELQEDINAAKSLERSNKQ